MVPSTPLPFVLSPCTPVAGPVPMPCTAAPAVLVPRTPVPEPPSPYTPHNSGATVGGPTVTPCNPAMAPVAAARCPSPTRGANPLVYVASVAATLEGPTVGLDTPAVSVLAPSMAVLADTGCSVSRSTTAATAAHAAANSPRRFHALAPPACPSVCAGS